MLLWFKGYPKPLQFWFGAKIQHKELWCGANYTAEVSTPEKVSGLVLKTTKKVIRKMFVLQPSAESCCYGSRKILQLRVILLKKLES